MSLFRHSNRGLITKGTKGSPVGKRPPVCQTCTKHMRGVNKRGTMGGPRLPVFTRLCVCVQGWPYPPRTFFYRDNRSSGVCSQRSSDVIRVQSLWECLKYRDKGKNKRSPRRVWSITTVCAGMVWP